MMIKSLIKHAMMTGSALALTACTITSLPSHPANGYPAAKPDNCTVLSYEAIMATPGHDPTLYIDYIAMDNGYGQWTLMSPNDATPLGYATQEDSLIYPHLECIYSMPEYPAGPMP